MLGDLGVGLQRRGDLAEVLGAGPAERADHLAELGEFGAHLGVHLVEPGVDDVLLRREFGGGLVAGGGRQGSELLALEDRRLLQRRLDRSVTLGGRLQPGLGDGAADGGIDRQLQGFVGGGLLVDA